MSSEIIYDKMNLENKYLAAMEEVLEILKENKTEIVLTMGAGNIDAIAEGIIKVLKNKK